MGRSYRAFGLQVESELPLPGAMEAAAGAPNLSIVTGTVPVGTERGYGPYAKADGGLVFTMAGVARYGADAAGTRITVEAEAGADPEMVVAMLLATGLPMMLWLRGQIVLHAAAMVLPGCTRAVAIAGASGVGKSTLLRRFERAGVVSDDMIAIDAGVCAGLPGGTWLRGQGLREQGNTRSFQAVAPARQLAEARPGLIVVLERGEGGLERLRGAAALAAILRNLHRPLVPRMMGRMPALLPRVAELARTVPVYCHQSNATDQAALWRSDALLEQLQRLAEGVEETIID